MQVLPAVLYSENSQSPHADVNVTIKQGLTALSRASSLTMIKLLLHKGLKPVALPESTLLSSQLVIVFHIANCVIVLEFHIAFIANRVLLQRK